MREIFSEVFMQSLHLFLLYQNSRIINFEYNCCILIFKLTRIIYDIIYAQTKQKIIYVLFLNEINQYYGYIHVNSSQK